MKQTIINISLVLLTIFVLFLSIGISVSKMNCSKEGKIFIGTEVPNCTENIENTCGIDVEAFSCCNKKETLESCCPQTEDNSCASETANIQFDFETLMTTFEFDFKSTSILLCTYFLYDQPCNLREQLNYPGGISLLKIHKPELAEVQSFLL